MTATNGRGPSKEAGTPPIVPVDKFATTNAEAVESGRQLAATPSPQFG